MSDPRHLGREIYEFRAWGAGCKIKTTFGRDKTPGRWLRNFPFHNFVSEGVWAILQAYCSKSWVFVVLNPPSCSRCSSVIPWLSETVWCRYFNRYCTVHNRSVGGWGVTPPIWSGGVADGHTTRDRAAAGGRKLPYLAHIRPKMGPDCLSQVAAGLVTSDRGPKSQPCDMWHADLLWTVQYF